MESISHNMASTTDLQLILKQKHIPADISHKILCMVFQMEHRDKVHRLYLYDSVIEKAHAKNLLGDSDLETSINYYLGCNCCQRHQINKPCITSDGLVIITRACVFKPTRYYDIDDEINQRCKCDCRHMGRRNARKWMEKESDWGPMNQWERSQYKLMIQGHDLIMNHN